MACDPYSVTQFAAMQDKLQNVSGVLATHPTDATQFTAMQEKL